MTAGPTDAERLRLRQRPEQRAVMRQRWRRLGFLHWPVEEAAIAALLPPGLEVDTFEGVAYVGLVPFTIPRTRTPRLGLPLAPAFHEANLRTYVHRGGREPGVWFFSLEAASRLAVAGARVAYHLPYFYARMELEVDAAAPGPTVRYRSRRIGRRSPSPAGGAAELSASYGPAGPAAPAVPGTLAFFLAERYLLYAWSGRVLSSARVHHAPYPLAPGFAADVRETLTAAARLPPPGTPPSLVHYAEEVDVEVFAPRRLA